MDRSNAAYDLLDHIDDDGEKVRVLEIIQLFESCNACGESIVFRYLTDWLKREVTEKGYCPSCRLALPVRVYNLV